MVGLEFYVSWDQDSTGHRAPVVVGVEIKTDLMPPLDLVMSSNLGLTNNHGQHHIKYLFTLGRPSPLALSIIIFSYLGK